MQLSFYGNLVSLVEKTKEKKEKKRNGLAGIRTWVARTAVEDATLYAMKAYLLEAG